MEEHTDGSSLSTCLSAPEMGAGSSGTCTFQTRGNDDSRKQQLSKQTGEKSLIWSECCRGGRASAYVGEPAVLGFKMLPETPAPQQPLLCTDLQASWASIPRRYRCYGSPSTSQPHAEPDRASSLPSEKISQSRMP